MEKISRGFLLFPRTCILEIARDPYKKNSTVSMEKRQLKCQDLELELGETNLLLFKNTKPRENLGDSEA